LFRVVQHVCKLSGSNWQRSWILFRVVQHSVQREWHYNTHDGSKDSLREYIGDSIRPLWKEWDASY